MTMNELSIFFSIYLGIGMTIAFAMIASVYYLLKKYEEGKASETETEILEQFGVFISELDNRRFVFFLFVHITLNWLPHFLRGIQRRK